MNIEREFIPFRNRRTEFIPFHGDAARMDDRSQTSQMGLAFALTVLVAGCEPSRTPAEAEAIALVERLGGKITPDHQRSGKPIVEVALGGTKITDGELARLAVFTELRTLSLFDTSVGDDGLRHLASLASLQTLYLGRTRITDAGLKHLAAPAGDGGETQSTGLRSLQTLGLSDTAITDASLDLLAGLAELKSVNLRHTRVTASGVAGLKQSRPPLVVHY